MDSTTNEVFKNEVQKVNPDNWCAPEIEDLNSIPKGDMPGDKIDISDSHVSKANKIFPELVKRVQEHMLTNMADKLVISVYGGSGVGKSEIASLLSYYFNDINIECYVLSGDNYPHRIPTNNDAERYRKFRESGLKALETAGKVTDEVLLILKDIQKNDNDANPEYIQKYSWLAEYQQSGREALAGYLGTKNEIDFDRISDIITKFKNGEKTIKLKRMGRTEDDLWEDSIDFSDTKIIIIEWTHGNNDYLRGVDIPILLNSTPKETLGHRMKRNRDGGADSPFTTMVLKNEQELLHSQSSKAKMIVTKGGSFVNHKGYMEIMENENS